MATPVILMYTFVYCTVTNNSLFDSERLTYFFPAGQLVLNEGKSPTCELPYDVTVSTGVNLCDPCESLAPETNYIRVHVHANLSSYL